MNKAKQLREQLVLLRERMGVSVLQLAKLTDIPEGTLKGRLRNPGKFRLEEVWRLENVARPYDIKLLEG